MTSKLFLKFGNIDHPVEIALNDSINGRYYARYIKEATVNTNGQAREVTWLPESRDYIEEFRRLVKSIDHLNWNVSNENITQKNFNLWHRWIEDNADHLNDDSLAATFMELHMLLHASERQLRNQVSKLTKTNTSVRLHWLVPAGVWPREAIHDDSGKIEAGDIVTVYPKVGKQPAWCLRDNEKTEDLPRVCRLTDTVCPAGFEIYLHSAHRKSQTMIDQERENLIKWYHDNILVTADMFSEEDMLKYNGIYKIGRVVHERDIEALANSSGSTNIRIVNPLG